MQIETIMKIYPLSSSDGYLICTDGIGTELKIISNFSPYP